jgi:hypothetical protein
VSQIEKLFSEEPRRPPAEIACLLARSRFWKDERRRLIGTHRDWPDAAYLLDLEEELAHAFVMVLSRFPAADRRVFADAFYEQRTSRGAFGLDADDRTRLALAAAIVLNLAEIIGEPDLYDERTLDLLHGAAQGDDLTLIPSPAAAEVWNRLARIRGQFELDDPADPRGTAAIALAEVLDPSSGVVDLKEILALSAWAAVETVEPPRVLQFLLDADSLLTER